MGSSPNPQKWLTRPGRRSASPERSRCLRASRKSRSALHPRSASDSVWSDGGRGRVAASRGSAQLGRRARGVESSRPDDRARATASARGDGRGPEAAAHRLHGLLSRGRRSERLGTRPRSVPFYRTRLPESATAASERRTRTAATRVQAGPMGDRGIGASSSVSPGLGSTCLSPAYSAEK